MVESTEEKTKFFDPHFHLVDWADGPHKKNEALWKTLYPQMPVFGIKDYENLILGDGAAVELMGGMFIEANATQDKRIEEAQWVDKQLDASDRPYGIVAGIDLQADITETIAANRKLPRFRGFRNILNWDEGAEVNMDPEVTSNRFTEEKVRANFKVMETEDVTFEFMLNPHQYAVAADVLDTCPKLRVIIDHRGFPKTVEQIKSEEYWTGMKRFAAMPNVYMKISFFGRTDAEWKDGATVIEKSIELIKLFTPQRCMFATNFPVDNADVFGTWTMKRMVETFNAIGKGFTPEEQACLWRETALKAYRMDLAAGDGL
jgi:predicted TIM-barrel fold metal-dependent hydrolase